MHSSVKDVYAVILVGGKGKRLRPLSTDARPKAFLSVTRDRKTLFRRTLDRIRKVIPRYHILVSANASHARLVKKDFPQLTKENLLLEPVSRNTAPAIAYAASVLRGRHGSATMVVLPSDQYTRDEKKYIGAIKKGIDFVRDNKEALIVLGVKPAFPSTAFGYVKISTLYPLPSAKEIYKVEQFVEKPGIDAAKKYMRSGNYLWNAGAFIFNTDVILDNFKRHAPRIYDGVNDVSRIKTIYKTLPDISIDYAMMERADDIYCVKGAYGWQDLGSFDALKDVLRDESRRFIMKGEKIIKIL